MMARAAMMFFDQLITRLRAGLHVALLARVIRYDAKTMRADVQPLNMEQKPTAQEDGDETWYNASPLIDVPVIALGLGGLVVRPAYSKGDLVVVLCLDHDMDAILQYGDTRAPETDRAHELDDAVIIGGIAPDPKPFGALPDGALALGTPDGGTLIAIAPGEIRITAPAIYLNDKRWEG